MQSDWSLRNPPSTMARRLELECQVETILTVDGIQALIERNPSLHDISAENFVRECATVIF